MRQTEDQLQQVSAAGDRNSMERRLADRGIEEVEEESASLVDRETLPDNWCPPANHYNTAQPQQRREEDEDEEKLFVASRYHEELLHQAGGNGAFQRTVMIMCGLSLASDAVELFAIPYVMPSAEHELCLDECYKGWLGIASLVGMVIGGFIWGTLGDHLGRRRSLLSALSTNAVFGVVTAFMPTFHLFLITRLCSGMGIGGSLPVVFTFYSEFLVRKRRGYYLGLLLLFWAAGGIFVALMAWAILPRTGYDLLDSKQLHFGQWRTFLLSCSIPVVVSVAGIAFLPESPRFLLEVGRGNEALYVYRKIYSGNSPRKSGVEYQLTEMVLPGKCPVRPVLIPSKRGFFQETKAVLQTFLKSYAQMFSSEHVRLTVCLVMVWAMLSFGFYGMTTWLPSYATHMRRTEFRAKAVEISNTVIHDETFNSSLENVHFRDTLFFNVHFSRIVISHNTFSNCSFWNCTFSDVHSSQTYFTECDFEDTVFMDTDFYMYKFKSCSMSNTFFYSTKGGCNLDFDIGFDLSDLFFKNLFSQLAIFLGTLASAFLLDRFGRVHTMGASLLLAAACIPFFWLVNGIKMILVFEAIFSFVCISGWNALDVLSTEAYPAHIRSTSYGFLITISRLAAILGNVAFGGSATCPKAVPLVTGAVVLLAGAVCTNHLPETKDFLL